MSLTVLRKTLIQESFSDQPEKNQLRKLMEVARHELRVIISEIMNTEINRIADEFQIFALNGGPKVLRLASNCRYSISTTIFLHLWPNSVDLDPHNHSANFLSQTVYGSIQHDFYKHSESGQLFQHYVEEKMYNRKYNPQSRLMDKELQYTDSTTINTNEEIFVEFQKIHLVQPKPNTATLIIKGPNKTRHQDLFIPYEQISPPDINTKKEDQITLRNILNKLEELRDDI